MVHFCANGRLRTIPKYSTFTFRGDFGASLFQALAAGPAPGFRAREISDHRPSAVPVDEA